MPHRDYWMLYILFSDNIEETWLDARPTLALISDDLEFCKSFMVELAKDTLWGDPEEYEDGDHSYTCLEASYPSSNNLPGFGHLTDSESKDPEVVYAFIFGADFGNMPPQPDKRVMSLPAAIYINEVLKE